MIQNPITSACFILFLLVFFLVAHIYASAMVTSTSTPGSILMDVWTTVKEISLVLSTGDNLNQGDNNFIYCI